MYKFCSIDGRLVLEFNDRNACSQILFRVAPSSTLSLHVFFETRKYRDDSSFSFRSYI